MTATFQDISEAMAGVVESAGKSVVTVSARRRPASGIVWGDGLVLTSAHAIERDDAITVSDGGEELPAALLGRDGATDLALLKVEGLKAPAAALGDSSKLRLGQLVLALGRPGSLQVSLGTVSSLSAEQRGWRGGGLDKLIQTDATLLQGFSGGPLLDAEGRVVGVNSWYFGRGNTRAIPVEVAARVAKSLQEHGRVKHAFLGIGTQPVYLSDAAKAELGQETGLMVITVDANGPAATAGLLQGDIVVGLGGAPVARMRDLFRALHGVDAGSAHPVKVVRAGEVREIQVTLGERAE